MTNRNIFKAKKWHLWLSLPAGVILTLICLTGAIMVFQTELTELLNKERYYVENNEPLQNRVNLDDLVAEVSKTLKNDTIVSLKISEDSRRTIEAGLSSAQRSYIYIDPYTAQVVGAHNVRSGFFNIVMRLHRWLMLPDMALGKTIVGISTIFMIFILITGFVRWHKVRRYRIKWKNVNSMRRVFDLHKVLGFYAAIILLVCCLSGLMWSFKWYQNSVATIFGIKTAQQQQDGARPDSGTQSRAKRDDGEKRGDSTLGLGFWERAYNASKEVIDNPNHITINKSGAITTNTQHSPHHRAADNYRFDRATGSVSLVSKYGDTQDSRYMMTWAYVLHVGSWGGVFTKILYFLAALIGAALPITGYILFFRRKFRTRS